MELNWSTFALELLNFLVLVWILKRFLYKPVLDVIQKRRAGIEKTLEDARELKAEAQGLQNRYESRLADWDVERQQARDALAHEIEQERGKRLSELQTSLDQEREKARVAEERRLSDLGRQAEQTALANGARFATRLLEQVASPELQSRIFAAMLEALSALPEGRIRSLSGNAKVADGIVVTSAYPLSTEQRGRLQEMLTQAMQADTQLRFEVDATLLAGLRVTVGAWVLGMNLADELEGFTRLAHGDGSE